MLMLDEPSRAWATDATREPWPSRTQKLVRLSATEPLRALTLKAYCVSSVATRRPKPPVCAAAATTEEVPVPCEPSHLLRLPDSKPSAKTVSTYCERAARGVMAVV